MKICFPVWKNEGLESKVFNHFGSAPFFIVLDTKTMDVTTITNNDQDHTHGACNPIRALNGDKVDAIVVGGIGAGALSQFNQADIRVYQAQASSVQENLSLFENQSLPEFALKQTCMGHDQGGGCSH